ncbi:MAG: Spo0E family sporulation regulatory protein-aspartic acid phosphatase [Clostridia bacterium]
MIKEENKSKIGRGQTENANIATGGRHHIDRDQAIKQLKDSINIMRVKLYNLIDKRIDDLTSKEIINASRELDELIKAYLQMNKK